MASCPEDFVSGAAVAPGSGTFVAIQHTVSEGRLSRMRTREGTILVAEDDPSIRRLVEWALEDEGFVVEAVPDGADAIRRLVDLIAQASRLLGRSRLSLVPAAAEE